jgi:hypothetical protein
MTGGAALMLLGFGLGTMLMGRRSRGSIFSSLRDRADVLREQAAEAQQHAAKASQFARAMTVQWSEADEAARRQS